MADADQTPDVLTSLPKTRPQRRSAKRDSARGNGAAKPKSAAAAKPKAGTPKAPAATKPASTKPKAAPKPKLPPAGFEAPRDESRGTPSGAELVGTAIQAAGELVQIGAAVGKQTLKGVLGRLGR